MGRWLSVLVVSALAGCISDNGGSCTRTYTYTVKPPWTARSVWAFGDDDIIAAGPSSRRWHNGQYVWDHSNPMSSVMSIAAVAPDDVYAIANYNVERWSYDDPATVELATSIGFRELWVADRTHVFAGGSTTDPSFATSGSVWFSAGDGQWTRLANNIPAVWALTGTTADDVFAVGYGVVHLSGGSWRTETTPPSRSWDSAFATRSVFGNEDVWVAGYEAKPGYLPMDGAGFVIHSVGDGTWTETALGLEYPILWGASATEVYVAERAWVSGTCRMLRWDGNAWSAFPSPPDCNRGVQSALSIGPNDFIVLDEAGRIEHSQNGSWTVIDPTDPGETMTVTETGHQTVAIDGYTSCSLDARR